MGNKAAAITSRQQGQLVGMSTSSTQESTMMTKARSCLLVPQPDEVRIVGESVVHGFHTINRLANSRLADLPLSTLTHFAIRAVSPFSGTTVNVSSTKAAATTQIATRVSTYMSRFVAIFILVGLRLLLLL